MDESIEKDESIENKRRIIDRIEHILDAYSRGLEINKQSFEKNAEGRLSDKKTNRDRILGLLGIAISVMLGLVSAPAFIPDSIRSIVLYAILFGALPIGLALFLYETRGIRRISKEYSKIEEAFLKGITFTNFMRGFLAIKTFDHHVKVQELNTLSDYFRIIEAGITADTIMKICDAINRHILDKVEYNNLYVIAIRRGYTLYQTYSKKSNSPKAELLKGIMEQDIDLFREFDYYVRLLSEKGNEIITEANERGIESTAPAKAD